MDIGFGKRLANMRKVSGLTQLEMGEKVGVSNGLLPETDGLPAHPSNRHAGKGANVSIDELLRLKRTKETLSSNLASLWRRLKVIENFSEKEKKSVLQYVEIITEKHRPQQKATS